MLNVSLQAYYKSFLLICYRKSFWNTVSLVTFSGEAGKNCIALPAAVRPDPGQHAAILPQGPFPHLFHFKWSSKYNFLFVVLLLVPMRLNDNKTRFLNSQFDQLVSQVCFPSVARFAVESLQHKLIHNSFLSASGSDLLDAADCVSVSFDLICITL